MRTKNKWALFLVACFVCIGEREVVGRHQRGNDGESAHVPDATGQRHSSGKGDDDDDWH